MSIKTHIERNFAEDSLSIYFINERDGGRYLVKPVQLVFKKIEEGELIEPSIKLGSSLAQPFLQSIAEALDKNGVKTDNDAKIAGTLEATRYHLEDLRKLLKVNK